MASEIKDRPGRGGVRKGAGRPKGAKAAITKSKERAAAVNAAVVQRLEQIDGKMDPVEAIMETVEWAVRNWRVAVDQHQADAKDWAECVNDWAAKAAPYIRPRLAAVEARVNVNVTIFDRIERGRQRLIAA